MAKTADLDDNAKKIIKALGQSGGPFSNKQLAQATGLDAKKIGPLVKKLREAGFADSPARCKYGLTSAGKSQLK